ncbi:hypothetical protein DXG01_001370 [Tephrocybe rancida]|nr:hypothetical protein DXG01_001370 [Tephrocybe rancida]
MYPTLTSILGVALRYGPQRLALYPSGYFNVPHPFFSTTPAFLGIPYMAPMLKTPDGVNLSCFLVPQTSTSLADDYKVPREPIENVRVDLTPAAADARATVIVFHGNAMHNWELMSVVKNLFELKCNVLLMSYRGYSYSTGKPSEKGLKIDAQTGLDYLLSQPYLAQAPIIVCGHSLGGGVAIDLASRNPSEIAAVMVSNTFTSIPDIVRTWPIIGVFSFLCTQHWDSADKMRRITTGTPVLMISGRRDLVIPPQLMDGLWQATQNRGKRPKPWFFSKFGWFRSEQEDGATDFISPHDKFVTIKRGDHDTTPQFPEYWAAIEKFVEVVNKATTRRPANPQVNPLVGEADRRWIYDRQRVYVDIPIVGETEGGEVEI